MIRTSSTERGFTLLEVLIALSIFAVLALAMGSAAQHLLAQARQLEDRLLANWLADNHLALLRLQPVPAPGRRQIEIDFAQRRWRLEETRHGLAGGLLQVELLVRPAGGQAVLHRASTWLERAGDEG